MSRFLACMMLLLAAIALHAQDSLVAVRHVAGLNTREKAEAYPILSEDGLRLYFTSNRDSANHFYYVTRASVNEPFGQPILLPLPPDDRQPKAIVTSMTADERTVFLFQSWAGGIKKCTRASVSEPFGAAEEIKGLGAGPTAGSPDGREFFSGFNGTKDSSLLRHYTLNEQDSAVQDYSISFAPRTEVRPVQFSRDGLSCYMTLYSKDHEDPRLLRFSRASVNDRFGSAAHAEVLPLPRDLCQVALNGDRTILVGVVSPSHVWSDDDLVYYRIVRPVCVLPEGITTVLP